MGDTTERIAEAQIQPLAEEVILPAETGSAPRKRKKKSESAIAPDEYIVRRPNGEEVAASTDIFDGLEALKKLPPGYELIRRSDGARLSYNTRQKPNDGIMPTAGIPSRKR